MATDPKYPGIDLVKIQILLGANYELPDDLLNGICKRQSVNDGAADAPSGAASESNETISGEAASLKRDEEIRRILLRLEGLGKAGPCAA